VSVCLVLLVTLLGFSAGEEGRLMVSKDFKEDYHVMGRNLTVEFTFHNIGDGYLPPASCLLLPPACCLLVPVW